jgi:hypothetical protein
MDQTTLVDSKIDTGKTLLEFLLKAKMTVDAAFWCFDSESNKWSFIIISSDVDKNGAIATYMKLFSILENVPNGKRLQNANLTLANTKNATYKKILERIRGSIIEDFWLDNDLYIYYMLKTKKKVTAKKIIK